MDHDASKYFIEHSENLTEGQKVRMAADLRELERRGIIEYRDGRWSLAPGVEIEETPDGPVARFRNKEEGVN